MLAGREFFKMTGSGNDFVVFDARREPAGELAKSEAVRAICARGTGVGADGVVFIEQSTRSAFRMRYFNSDGSLASLCGNASLCSVKLATELGAVPKDEAGKDFEFESDSGRLRARMRDGLPEIDLQPVRDVTPDMNLEREAGELRIGYALAGVPHLVIHMDSIADADIVGRGRALRHHPALPGGANVNFVARQADGWAMRTYERGVEAETLACGTGAVATAILAGIWGGQPEPSETKVLTRSGQVLIVRLQRQASGWVPSLRGEGRVVFRGTLTEL